MTLRMLAWQWTVTTVGLVDSVSDELERMQKLTESLHEMREAISKQLNNLYNVVTYRNANIMVAKRARQMKLEDEAAKASKPSDEAKKEETGDKGGSTSELKRPKTWIDTSEFARLWKNR